MSEDTTPLSEDEKKALADPEMREKVEEARKSPTRNPRPRKSTPEPEPENSVSAEEPAATKRDTLSGEGTDDVFLERIVMHNKASRKSLSVRHLQFRLAELGYGEALVDSEGYYGDRVQTAVAAFQHDRGLVSTGEPDAETVSRIFQNDSNVNLHL